MTRGDIRHIFVGPTGKRTGQTIEYFVDANELREMFGKYGTVVDVKIRSNAKDVFAFIHFDASEACDKAIRDLNGTTLKNTNAKIKVSWGAYNPGQKRQHRYINRTGPSSGGYGAAAENGFYPHDEQAPRTVRYEPRQPYRTNQYRPIRRQPSYSPRRRSRTPPRRRRNSYSPERRSRSYSHERTNRRAAKRRRSNSPPPRRMREEERYNKHRSSPSPRGAGERGRYNQSYSRSPAANRGRSHSRDPSREKTFRLIIEDLPTEMEWEDLKAIGKKYGGSNSIVSGKCWSEKGLNQGIIEFNRASSQLKTYESLRGHRINGHKIRLFLDD